MCVYDCVVQGWCAEGGVAAVLSLDSSLGGLLAPLRSLRSVHRKLWWLQTTRPSPPPSECRRIVVLGGEARRASHPLPGGLRHCGGGAAVVQVLPPVLAADSRHLVHWVPHQHHILNC